MKIENVWLEIVEIEEHMVSLKIENLLVIIKIENLETRKMEQPSGWKLETIMIKTLWLGII